MLKYRTKLKETLVRFLGQLPDLGEGKGYNSSYRFTAWKNIFQNYELINSLEFFFFHTYELYNEGLQGILHSFHYFKIAAF